MSELEKIKEIRNIFLFIKEKYPSIPKEYKEWVKEKEEKKLPEEEGRGEK